MSESLVCTALENLSVLLVYVPLSQPNPVQVGSFVWAKFGPKVWWPALVIQGEYAGMDPPKPDHMWVCWFGDYKISEVSDRSGEKLSH